MERKIHQKLCEWKKDEGGKIALLIDGARRVGKSHSVATFAKTEYKSAITIDFNNVSADLKHMFYNYLHDLDSFFLYLSAYYKVKLHERKSLIVFDEVQLFPRARAAIKYLVADGRYDYIETGSLISIRKNVQDIVIPSEERHITMHPMDFEEFLWAMEAEGLMEIIQKHFQEKIPLGQAMHRRIMHYFRQYLIVGGMPQAVKAYLDNPDFSRVDQVKRDILNLYRADMAKYAEGYDMKVRGIFDEIPAWLGRAEKKIKLSSLQKDARLRNYEDALLWLSDSMIINPCYLAAEPSIGLRMKMERLTLKCYMADTGLLISHAFDEKGIVSEEIYRKLLFDKLEINKGMIFENIVAQMLAAGGHKLYFYSNYNRTDSSSRMEIDFLIAKSLINNRHNISPIEVKSGKNYTLSSLNKFISKYAEQTHTPYLIHADDLKVENGIVYLRVYMTSML